MQMISTERVNEMHLKSEPVYSIKTAIANSWSKISPFWPLKNLIATNPMAGFEDVEFKTALKQAHIYFQQKNLPMAMDTVNRATIKWLQAFFDEGQATIPMPLRERGFLSSIVSLLRFDHTVHQNDKRKRQWLETLSENPEIIITKTLLSLGIPYKQQEQFLILMLTTLPGWAAHIQYRTNWENAKALTHPVTQAEYLAFRLVLTYLIWPDAKKLLAWHKNACNHVNIDATYQNMLMLEAQYQQRLVDMLNTSRSPHTKNRPTAQMLFCIDVRSEPFRRALESQGNYETFGVAGFFGVPISINNPLTGESYASCPVLLKPQHEITETSHHSKNTCHHQSQKSISIKKLYQSLKYTFTTPFSLVEIIGIFSGLWMGLKSITPRLTTRMKSCFTTSRSRANRCTFNIESIPFEKQVEYAAGLFKTIGLRDHVAQLVVLCGHGSTTQNNAYATALHCGACGGHQGAPNARVLANILNSKDVRHALKQTSLQIPEDTFFLAAQHDTTTDDITLYDEHTPAHLAATVESFKHDLKQATQQNTLHRSATLNLNTHPNKSTNATSRLAHDWAQVRPEWGLAKNAAFIVGPRWLTQHLDLEGRAFLHSYEWADDSEGQSLTGILTAPMVVAQWINAQYLFSTLDNVAFGSGSKVTQNITGKMGIMQGNASDLMHGLPLQSVYFSDDTRYHDAVRLTLVVYAPKWQLMRIIQQQPVLQKLFGNGWVRLINYDPQMRKILKLTEKN